jgi:hypothetical protein
MSSVENAVEIKGRIVKWVDQLQWGIINFYSEGGISDAPRKVFLHASKVISTEKPKMGSCVMFILGPARSANELQAALKVRVITRSEAI